jgi:hypothetical protein
MENATLTPPQRSTISPRASAIARGLRRSGRVGDLRAALSGAVNREDCWIVMPAARDQFYFLSLDGFVLRRGDNVIDALELQFGFVAAMARVGGMRAE